MKKIQRNWDPISKDKRRIFTEDIISFFREKRDEEIGVIAAEEVLDFFLENIGGELYNKGVEDSKGVLRQRFEDLEVDLELLIKK